MPGGLPRGARGHCMLSLLPTCHPVKCLTFGVTLRAMWLACRLFKSFEEDEERTRRLAAALEHESTASSLHFALFPRKTRDGGLQPSCREPVVSMMVCWAHKKWLSIKFAPAEATLSRCAGVCCGSVFTPRWFNRPPSSERMLSRERFC